MQVARLQGALASKQLASQPVRLNINVHDRSVASSVPGLPAAFKETAPPAHWPPWNDLEHRSTDAVAQISEMPRETAGSLLDIKSCSSNASHTSFGPGCLVRAARRHKGTKPRTKLSCSPVFSGRRRQRPGNPHDQDTIGTLQVPHGTHGRLGKSFSGAEHVGFARECPKDTALDTYMHPTSLILPHHF